MAQQEIDACRKKTEEAALSPGVHRSANAATGAVLGMTIGAAAGSGIGLVVGLLGGTFKPLEPDPSYADAVTSCLKEKGYEVRGWE